MFSALLKRLTDTLDDSSIGKYAADKDLLEGAMAAAAWISAADGLIEQTEKSKVLGFIERSPHMKHFSKSEAAKLYTSYADDFDFDPGLGEDRVTKELAQVKGDEKQRLVVRLAMAIARADGEVEPAEVGVVRKICTLYGIPADDFV